ncbi:MAG: hypothetical protein ACOYNY_42240 [Caldilineaceae bacterium]|jgi:hypothetical protein
MVSHAVTIQLPDPLYQQFAARSRQTRRTLEEELVTAFAIDLPLLPFAETVNLQAYHEVMDFLASGASPSAILQFQLSSEARQRASNLLEKERTQGLTDAEAQELDFYVELGDFLGILRAKAQLQLQAKLS